MISKKIKIACLTLLLPVAAMAQETKKISLREAITLGIANSKQLKLSQNKIDESLAKMEVVNDHILPEASLGFMYNHAEIPTSIFKIGGAANPIHLPNRTDAFIGTAGIQELVYGGNKWKYAKESTRLLAELAKSDLDKNKEEVGYAVIQTYFTLFKLQQSKKVIEQNLTAIAGQLKQAQRFFEQGMVTKNDVLRFQLQQANVSMTGIEIESNRKVINYNLDLLLGLPGQTEILIDEQELKLPASATLEQYMAEALGRRHELQQLALQHEAVGYTIKDIKADQLPTVGIGANAYYINPSGNFIPPAQQFLLPVTLGVNISWNLASLWKNKNKVSEAKIRQQAIDLQKDAFTDKLKTEVNQSFNQYQLALQKIALLQTSIEQAGENDRLLESKYKNNIASATDRIDAETLLYQAKINLEIAKADAGLAYYTLLKSTGKIAN